jgi:hypothetical protein
MLESLVAAVLLLRRAGGGELPLLAYERLDRCETMGRERFGPWLWSAIAGASLLTLAGLLVRPALHSVALGQHYAALASDPFSASPNPVGYRLLTPLLSHLVGLHGDGILIVNLAFSCALLVLVHRYFASHGARPGDALAAPASLALSLVTLAPLYFGGYCDPLTYLAIFGAWAWRRRPIRVGLCVLVGLMNHEVMLFVVPWIAFESWRAGSRRERALLVAAVAAALLAHLAYRTAVGSLRPVQFSLEYYLAPLRADPLHWARQAGHLWGLGLFTVFRLLWLLPLWNAWAAWRERAIGEMAGMALLLGGAGASLFVAFDTSRLWALAFPLLLLAMERAPGPEAPDWRPWFLAVFLANFLVPPLFTAEHLVVMLHSPLAYTLLSLFGFPR